MDHKKIWHRNLVPGQNLFCERFVQGQYESLGARSGVRYVQQLQDRGNIGGGAAITVYRFRKIEYYVRTQCLYLLEKIRQRGVKTRHG